MDVAIIGGGMTGLVTAFYLAKRGVPVTLFEKEKEVGGLSRSEEILHGFRWDRYYHVILSTDTELLSFLEEIGLAHDVHFRETLTGFYTDGHLYSMSNTLEFLRFKPLSFWNKLRLGAGILYTSRINNWKRLEKTSVKDWLIRVFGRKNYEKMWEPLLRSKLGTATDQASAAFIWGAVKRMYGTRHNRSKNEVLGCVKGGYHSVLTRIQERLLQKGVTILVGHGVQKLEPVSGRRIRLYCHNGENLDYDRVVATIPNPHITKLWPEMPNEFRLLLKRVKYLNLICAALVLRKSLSPFYVTNLTDNGFPFTGLIEATNVVPADVLGSKALVYLPRYSAPNDPFFVKPDEEALAIFVGSLKRIFPHLLDKDILATTVNRERYVQPIQEINYSQNVPPMQTPLENFYIANTTMILNSTLNNNQVIRVARRMADLLLSQ